MSIEGTEIAMLLAQIRDILNEEIKRRMFVDKQNMLFLAEIAQRQGMTQFVANMKKDAQELAKE